MTKNHECKQFSMFFWTHDIDSLKPCLGRLVKILHPLGLQTTANKEFSQIQFNN